VESFTDNMSVLSRSMFSYATEENRTAEDMVRYLEGEAHFRTFSDKVTKCYLDAHPEEKCDTPAQREALADCLKRRLTAGLQELHPTIQPDSIRKKVSNWFSDKNDLLTDRKTIFECCFLLKLTMDSADALLAYVTDAGIHWRDEKEAVYGYALKKGLTWPEAERLLHCVEEKMADFGQDNEKTVDSFTALVRWRVMDADSEDSLVRILVENRSHLGEFHNYAYRLFMEWIEILQAGEADSELIRSETLKELKYQDRMSVNEMLREYMLKPIVDEAKTRDKDKKDLFVIDIIRRRILLQWPNEDGLLDMKNRKRDVDRKTIILLFLATADDDEDERDDLPLFEKQYQTLNDTLSDCGFQLLDPRAPFDWLVLYSLCVDDLFHLDSRMQKLFEAVFPSKDSVESDA